MFCNLLHILILLKTQMLFRAGIVPPVFPWYTHKEEACRMEM